MSRIKLTNHSIKILTREFRAKLASIRELQNYILHYLETHPCVDCDETDICVLEFDHVRGDKSFQICDFQRRDVDQWALDREIAKCEVRCGNCHTKRHDFKQPRYLSEAVAQDALLKVYFKRGYNLMPYLLNQEEDIERRGGVIYDPLDH